MALAVFDTFDGTDGADLLDRSGQAGAAYARHPLAATGPTATWSLTGAGGAFSPHAGYGTPAHLLLSGSAAAVDHDLLAIWRTLSLATDRHDGITFRYSPTIDTGYRLSYESHVSFRRWQLDRLDAGTVVPLQNYVHTPAVDSLTEVRIECRSGGITIKWNGVARITSADTTYTAPGRIGLRAFGVPGLTSTTGLHLETIAAGPPGFILPQYLVSGPAGGPPTFASSAFTVSLDDGVDPGSVTITPSVTGLAGTCSPSSVTLTDGDRSGTFLFTPSAAGTGTLSFTNDEALEDPPDLTYVASYGPPARLAAWQGRIHDRHTTGSHPYCDGHATNVGGSEHYDPQLCYRLAREYCVANGLSPADWSAEEAYAQLLFRDWVLGTGETPAEYHVTTTGIRRHWEDTGDPDDLAAIAILLPPPDPVNAVEWAARRRTYGWCREVAFRILAALDREAVGLGADPYLDTAVETALGHVEQWTAGRSVYWGVWLKPWMMGLTARSLIAYWELYRDAGNEAGRQALVDAIPAAVAAICDVVWADAWYPPGSTPGEWDHGCIPYMVPAASAFVPIGGTVASAASPLVFTGDSGLSTQDDYYRHSGVVFTARSSEPYTITGYLGSTRRITLESSYPPPFTPAVGEPIEIVPNSLEPGASDEPSPLLNPMIAPAFAWTYWYRKHIAGDAAGSRAYRDRHDDIFNGQYMSWDTCSQHKEWNQALLWTTDGLAWRSRGDAAVASAMRVHLLPVVPGSVLLISDARGV